MPSETLIQVDSLFCNATLPRTLVTTQTTVYQGASIMTARTTSDHHSTHIFRLRVITALVTFSGRLKIIRNIRNSSINNA